MNFLLDHDVPERVGEVVRQEGHSVLTLRQVVSSSSSDDLVLRYAFDHQLILVTCNRDDFIALAQQQPHFGIIVVIRRRSRLAECSAILRLIRMAGESGLTGNINFA